MSASGKAVSSEPDTRISICRLCALVSGSKSFIPLYMNKEPQVTTKEINHLVPNVVSLDDGLPQEACFKCVENVSKCFKFINTVVDTQEKLRQMMRMSEAKSNESSPNHYYVNDDQWSMAVDEDSDLRTPKSVSKKATRPGQRLASALKMATKTSPARKSVNRAESSSSATSQASATDTYMNRLSACTFKPVSAAEESNPSPKRLFRCGVCFEKFTEKDVCLSHIAQQHSGVQKPVQPNTIFQAVRSGAAQSDLAKKAELLGKAGGQKSFVISGSGISLASATTKQLINGDAAASGSKLNAEESQPSETPKKPTVSRRKVLAIDSFYLEVDKQCTRYVCDDCGRMMLSRFAFLRHLYKHREPPKSEPLVIKDRPRKRVSLAERRFCNVCKKSVRDGLRHRMYHTIVKLESEFPSSASMLETIT